MTAEGIQDRDPSGGSACMDHRMLRYGAAITFALLVAWMAATAILDVLREPAAHTLRYYQIVPAWCALALAAVYYGRALARGIRLSPAGWGLSIALAVLPAGIVWNTSGWDAALTVALALAAWIPFSITWAIPVIESLGIRRRPAKAGIVILCAAAPPAFAALAFGGTVYNLAAAPADAPWRHGALATVLASLLVIAAAALVTRRARRAARAVLTPTAPAAATREPGEPDH